MKFIVAHTYSTVSPRDGREETELQMVVVNEISGVAEFIVGADVVESEFCDELRFKDDKGNTIVIKAVE